ncbi:serine/threonine protein kinase [Legionella rowbothamii]|uniref:serine/threonine protein kinase n=1 Tax=Legionella rowbothamii TaxID=96229 RepID=UPI0010553636|nr:serine/threonine-protein kinase [Legionella rowbothamii]
MGQVHLVSLGTTPLALKLERCEHSSVRQGRKFTLKPDYVNSRTVLTSPLSADEMPGSFLNSFHYWETSKDIPHSECIAEIRGLAFIKELNQWGVLYEYIDGYCFNKFCDDLKLQPNSTRKSKIIDISLQLAEALKLLDDVGQAHTDLSAFNILIRRSNHFPVLIDYGGHVKKEHRSIPSRQMFGERLIQLTQALDSTIDLSDLNQLANDCQTNKTFDELSWEIIINRLSHIKLRHSGSDEACVTHLGSIGLFKYAPKTDNSLAELDQKSEEDQYEALIG